MIASEEAGQEETSITEEAFQEMTGQEKCTRLHALTVVKNAKFPSNQLKVELFYARIALGQRKEVKKEQISK